MSGENWKYKDLTSRDKQSALDEAWEIMKVKKVEKDEEKYEQMTFLSFLRKKD